MALDDSTPPMLSHVSLDTPPHSPRPSVSACLCRAQLGCRAKHLRILRDTDKHDNKTIPITISLYVGVDGAWSWRRKPKVQALYLFHS